MKDLLARLEAAEAGSRELDLEIEKALGYCDLFAWYDEKDGNLYWHEHHEFGSTTAAELLAGPLHHYTTSLDAAAPGESIRHVMLLADGRWEASALDENGNYHTVEAATEALARRIAALKAKGEEAA